jgi:hypothetical protein
VQYSCETKLDAKGRVEVQVSSNEESGAESEDEFVTERKEPVPSAQLGGAVREQGCVGAVLQATKVGGWYFGLV